MSSWMYQILKEAVFNDALFSEGNFWTEAKTEAEEAKSGGRL